MRVLSGHSTCWKRGKVSVSDSVSPFANRVTVGPVDVVSVLRGGASDQEPVQKGVRDFLDQNYFVPDQPPAGDSTGQTTLPFRVSLKWSLVRVRIDWGSILGRLYREPSSTSHLGRPQKTKLKVSSSLARFMNIESSRHRTSVRNRSTG